MSSFWPVTDGAAIPKPPYQAVKEGAAEGIPLIFGSNRDEAKFIEAVLGATFPEIDDSQLQQQVELFLKEWSATDRIMNINGPEAKALSEKMMDAWIAFAAGGDPGIPDLPWQPYDAEDRATMIYGPNSRLEKAPFEAERAIWETILNS